MRKFINCLIKGTIIQVIKREERLKGCVVSHHRRTKLNYRLSYKFRVLNLKVSSLAEQTFQVRQGSSFRTFMTSLAILLANLQTTGLRLEVAFLVGIRWAIAIS